MLGEDDDPRSDSDAEGDATDAALKGKGKADNDVKGKGKAGKVKAGKGKADDTKGK